MKFEVKIDKLVADDPVDVVATALLKVVGAIRHGKPVGWVWDQNGNRVGSWSFVAEEEDGNADAAA